MNSLLTRIAIALAVALIIFALLPMKSSVDKGPMPEPAVAQVISSSEADQASVREAALRRQFRTFQVLSLSDPVFVDLNGDGAVEQARFTTREGKQGISIIDGKSKKEIILGAGNSFSPAGDNFDWVDYWGITTDSEVGETSAQNGEVTGTKKVTLAHPAIILREDEAGGGLIVWRNNRYEWVHQAD